MRRHSLLLLSAIAGPAFAQTAEPTASVSSPPVAPVDRGPRDTLSIGIGVASAPRYEGADDNRMIVAPALRGNVRGISFTTSGTGVFTDLVAGRGAGTKLVFGPIVHATLNRSSLKATRDPQIVALGKIKPAVEIGAQVGVSHTGLITSDYDNLSATVAVSHDVTGVHESLLVSPTVTYGTPLSRRLYVSVSGSADHVGRGYAQRYFGVTAAQSAASGLRAYAPDGGFKSVSATGLATYSLSGDLRRGAAVFGLVSRGWLLDAFRASPVVRNPRSWFATAGIGYTF